MAGSYRWHGEKFKVQMQAEMVRRLNACAIVVANHAKKLISIDGTGVGDGGSLIYNANPSAPGDPPHVQTGRLRGSVAWEIIGLIARVGTNVAYGRWLELGTTDMDARPWLRRALTECADRIRAIMSRPLRIGN
jgi:phage gpG-like protein